MPEDKTELSIEIPNSVKANGIYLVPPRLFEVAICDLKLANSSSVSTNIASSGKRSMLRLTAFLSLFVST